MKPELANESAGGTSGRAAGLSGSLLVWLGLGLALGSGSAPRVALAVDPVIGLRAPACELTPLAAVASPAAVSSFNAAAEPDAAPPAPYVRAFEGRITLVDFWASWCPTCEQAFGSLNALARDYHEAGLDVVAVNLDANPRDALDFLADHLADLPADRRVDFELARDATGRCPRGFGLVGMPQAFLIDASGRVRAVTRGFRAGDERVLRDRIEALLEGAPSAPRPGERNPRLSRR